MHIPYLRLGNLGSHDLQMNWEGQKVPGGGAFTAVHVTSFSCNESCCRSELSPPAQPHILQCQWQSVQCDHAGACEGEYKLAVCGGAWQELAVRWHWLSSIAGRGFDVLDVCDM